MMSAALAKSFLALLVVAFATAEPQLNVVGEGLMSNPVTSTAPGKGMRYAGPIVYTNEKPPIIYFPPPLKDAKPGINFGGGFGPFGKNKSPKSIKYVPMPHHDLPVLIYTSDKTPPIHVVHPPQENLGRPQGSISFGPPKDDFGPPPGSLASTYRGIIPAASSGRVVTSSYEIPSTSYGSPMKAFGESLDLPNTYSSEGNAQQHQSTILFGSASSPPRSESLGRPFGASSNKKPPHIMYSGHPPIHVFSQPDMFVRAPKQLPLKSYEELPPKASFRPPKSSFGQSSTGSFGASLRQHYRRPIRSPSQFSSPQRPNYAYPEENIIHSGSSNNPTSIHPPKNNQPSSPPSVSYGGGAGGPSSRPTTYSFSPQHSMFSFGPFSVEYGPPTEPLVSFSEPTGIYEAVNDENGKDQARSANGGVGPESQDGWMPGPPPTDFGEGQIKETEWDAPPSFHHGPNPGPMRSVFLPPSHSRPHRPQNHPQYPPPYGGSKLANLFSSFKLKRGKPKYAIAPKSMHKPPIIIYYGKKPPVHVYQKPETEEITATAVASNPAISVTSAESSRNTMGGDIHNQGNSEPDQSSHFLDNVDLTYGASQNTEVRVAAPADSTMRSESKNSMPERKPAIIQARPVDIFSSAELQPSIYMARNSLNTIFVSDMNGSGTKALKTFIVRRSEDSSQNPKYSIAEATVYPPMAQQQQQEGSIIISNIAQDRISGEQVVSLSQQQTEQQPELIQVPISSIPESTQVDLEQLTQQEVEDNKGESSNSKEVSSTTILVAPLSPAQAGDEVGNEEGSEK